MGGPGGWGQNSKFSNISCRVSKRMYSDPPSPNLWFIFPKTQKGSEGVWGKTQNFQIFRVGHQNLCIYSFQIQICGSFFRRPKRGLKGCGAKLEIFNYIMWGIKPYVLRPSKFKSEVNFFET